MDAFRTNFSITTYSTINRHVSVNLSLLSLRVLLLFFFVYLRSYVIKVNPTLIYIFPPDLPFSTY